MDDILVVELNNSKGFIMSYLFVDFLHSCRKDRQICKLFKSEYSVYIIKCTLLNYWYDSIYSEVRFVFLKVMTVYQ